MIINNIFSLNPVPNKHINKSPKIINQAFTGYHHLIKDPEVIKLNDLGDKYEKTEDKEDKTKLFEQEMTILEQELTQPDKYLRRAMQMGALRSFTNNRTELKTQLQINALCGIHSQFNSMKYLNIPQTYINNLVPTLEKIIKEAPDNSELNQQLKLYALYPISNGYDCLKPENKGRVDNILLNVLQNSSSDESKTMAFDILSSSQNKKSPIYNDIQNIAYKQLKSENFTPATKKAALINLGKINSPHLEKLIPDILNDKNVDHSLKLAATWCAGKVITTKNFNLLEKLLKISKNDKETLEIKEMALSSVAEYTKLDSEKVENIIKTVIETNSELKDTAEATLEKLSGKDQEKNYYLNKEILDKEKQEKYLTERRNYIQDVDKLKPEYQNHIDQALLPFRNILNNIIKAGGKFIFTDDTITGISKDQIGARVGDGRFADSLSVANVNNTIISNNSTLSIPENAVAHEFTHVFDKNFLDNIDRDKIDKLYENAKKEKRFMDYYSEKNQSEYFAQGYMNYSTPSIPHKYMDDKNDYNTGYNTKLGLKLKDPDLYDFIEHCIEKYNLDDYPESLIKENK